MNHPRGGEPGFPPPWSLPGADRSGPAGQWRRGRTPAGRVLRAPALSEAEARQVAAAVREAAFRARQERSTGQVIRAISDAAAELADPGTIPGDRARRTLAEELSWPGALASETLERMAEGWGEERLRALLENELGDASVLDGFVDAGAAGGRARSRRAGGPPLLFQVQSGNVPGVGVTGILRGLLVRSGMLVKTAREGPGLAAEFARSLARRDSLLGRCLAVTWWPGGQAVPEARVWARRAGLAVVYGGADAVRGVRELLPGHRDLVAYGPKVGVAVVLPDADLAEAAASLARDVCAYEQRGCVSPRLVFILPGKRRRPFAEALDGALSDEVKRSGRAPVEAGTAAAIRALRAEVDLGGRGADARVVGDEDQVAWTVITGSTPRLDTEHLPRVVRVYGVRDVAALDELLEPLEGRLQAVGYAGEASAGTLGDVAARLGACRVAPLGTVAWPPPDWRHDGRHQLLPLVRWTEMETRR